MEKAKNETRLKRDEVVLIGRQSFPLKISKNGELALLGSGSARWSMAAPSGHCDRILEQLDGMDRLSIALC